MRRLVWVFLALSACGWAQSNNTCNTNGCPPVVFLGYSPAGLACNNGPQVGYYNGAAYVCSGGVVVVANTALTATNCTSSAAPAVCAAAPAGSVVVAASGTTVVVNTSAVTASSQIFVQEDASLGTKLSVICNATAATAPPTISARVAGTSFTITTTAPTTNPRCFSYFIIN